MIPVRYWTCTCGAVVARSVCPGCGRKKPGMELFVRKPVDCWTCTCGFTSSGKFCAECGARKPDKDSMYRCNKCGQEFAGDPPVFCAGCGALFDGNDAP